MCAASTSAIVVLITVYVSYRHNWVLSYQDSASHLTIARRVLDSHTPGIAQLGTVWLPVPHLLMQPFIYNDFLYSSGLAGSCVGLLCFVITAVMLFLSIRLIAQHELAAWAGLAVFLSNPSALYLQTTALTEPVLMMSITISSYFLLHWSKRSSHASLLMAGLLSMMAVGSRYDGWFFSAVCGVVIALTVYLRWHDPARTEGVTLAYLAFPVYAMFLWFFYNWLIFADPLAFQHGQYSAAFQQAQIALAGRLPTKHHLVLSTLTYTWALLDDLGSPVLVAATIGLVTYLVTTRLRADSLVPYAFLSSYPFNILSLWLGQTTISTPQTNPPGYFNLRYGILLLPGAALFIAYLADYLLTRLRSSVVAGAVALVLLGQCALWIPGWPNSVPVLADGLHGASAGAINYRAAAPAARYLREHYRGGRILIDFEDFNSNFDLIAKIHMREYISNFSGNLWTNALQNPASYVTWVVVAPGRASDKVAAAIHDNVDFARHYTIQFRGGGYVVYRRTLPN
jgi:hypothetical protein